MIALIDSIYDRILSRFFVDKWAEKQLRDLDKMTYNIAEEHDLNEVFYDEEAPFQLNIITATYIKSNCPVAIRTMQVACSTQVKVPM